MKTTKILSALCGLALMLGGCANDDITNAAGSAKAPGVYVRLAGAAGKSNTRAGEEEMQTADEKKVNSVLAVLFDTHYKADPSDSESRIGFYKTVDATLVDEATGEYSFIVEKDATYDIWLVANADDALTGLLKGTDGTDGALRPGATVEDFSSLIAAQAPDRQGEFLMVSTYSEKVTTEIDKTYSIGEVHMERLAARFDLVNKAEGVTVRKVTYENRAVSSSLLTPNSMDPEIGYSTWSTPDGFSLEGSKEPEATGIQLMYSYENVSKSGEPTLPVISIEYEQDGAVRTHEVQLTDPEAPAGTVLPIKRNHLYRLVLTKAGKLNFNLEVADWEEAEAFGKSDLNEHLILPPDEQQKLNEQLLVYDLFAEHYVKSLDLTAKTVEFFDEIVMDFPTVPNSSYFSYNQLNTAGLTGNTSASYVTDADGNQYRLPTAGECMLLMPMASNVLNTDSEKDENGTYIIPCPIWNLNTTNKLYPGYFEEVVPLKNDEKQLFYKKDAILSDAELGFIGKSVIKRGRTTGSVNYQNSGLYPLLETGGSKVTMAPVYGLRFKETDQYAAYKWENVPYNGNPLKRINVIKIKALPKESDITIEDIVDNHSFWETGCIEFRLPTLGQIGANNANIQDKDVSARRYSCSQFLSSSKSPRETEKQMHFAMYIDSGQVIFGSVATKYGLKLVKVKKPNSSEQ